MIFNSGFVKLNGCSGKEVPFNILHFALENKLWLYFNIIRNKRTTEIEYFNGFSVIILWINGVWTAQQRPV